PPVLVLGAQDQAIDGDAGIIDQDVEPPRLLRDRLDRRVDGLGVGHVEALQVSDAARRPYGFQRLRSSVLVLRVIEKHLRPAARKRDRDRAPDAARSPGDQRDLFPQFHGVTSLLSKTDRISISGAIRLTIPATTVPVPNSSPRRQPSSDRRRTQLSQRTGAVTCWTRSAFTRSGSRLGAASKLCTTGMRGVFTRTGSSAAANRSAAGCMSAQ